MKLDNKIYEEKMKKTITVLNEEFESIRVGRASPRVLDRIQVSYYGTMSDIESVATGKRPLMHVPSLSLRGKPKRLRISKKRSRRPTSA